MAAQKGKTAAKAPAKSVSKNSSVKKTAANVRYGCESGSKYGERRTKTEKLRREYLQNALRNDIVR